jgi:hypothetical protein
MTRVSDRGVIRTLQWDTGLCFYLTSGILLIEDLRIDIDGIRDSPSILATLRGLGIGWGILLGVLLVE